MSGSDGATAPIPNWLSQLFNKQGMQRVCNMNAMNNQQMQMMMSAYGIMNQSTNGPAQNAMTMNPQMNSSMNSQMNPSLNPQTNPAFLQQMNAQSLMQQSNEQQFVPAMNNWAINGVPFMQTMGVPSMNMQQFGQPMNGQTFPIQMTCPPMNVPSVNGSQFQESKNVQMSSTQALSKCNENSDESSKSYKVFVGNLSPKVPHGMIQKILAACGEVLQWQRFSTFGFCEFVKQEGAERCVRLLHGYILADKKLTVKVDQKSKLCGSMHKSGGAVASAVRRLDTEVKRKFQQIEKLFREEIENYETKQKEKAISKIAKVLEEAEMPKEVLDFVQKEIGKFREVNKEESLVGGLPLRKQVESSRDATTHNKTQESKQTTERIEESTDAPESIASASPLDDTLSEDSDLQLVVMDSDDPKNNVRSWANRHVAQILSLPNIGQISSLRDDFLTPLKTALEALRLVELPVDDWSFVLLHVVSSKLTPDMLARFEEDYIGKSANYIPPFEDLIQFLEDDVASTEAKLSKKETTNEGKTDGENKTEDDNSGEFAADVEMVFSSPESDSESDSNIHDSKFYSDFKRPPGEKKCFFCHGGHLIKSCPHFGKLPPHDRFNFAKKRKLCFQCLGQHSRFVCKWDKPCPLCGGLHIAVLCKRNFQIRF